jgi:sulfite reductase (NADPH) hemoprotein beta-component
VIDQILEVYVAHRDDGERFLDCYRRIGIGPFKERIYADAH